MLFEGANRAILWCTIHVFSRTINILLLIISQLPTENWFSHIFLFLSDNLSSFVNIEVNKNNGYRKRKNRQRMQLGCISNNISKFSYIYWNIEFNFISLKKFWDRTILPGFLFNMISLADIMGLLNFTVHNWTKLFL